MNTKMIFHSALMLAVITDGVYAETSRLSINTPPQTSQGANSGTRKQTQLSSEVREAIKIGEYGKVANKIIQQLREREISPHYPEVMEMAMLLNLIRTTDAAIMTAYANKGKKNRLFLSEFVQDPSWLALYLNSGLVPHKSAVGIDVLYRIWESEKGKVRNKALASALASAWGGGETDGSPHEKTKNPHKYNPVWRYHFFVKNEQAGRLHPNFKNLQPWELRFVVGNPWQDWDDHSFEWALENINLPWDRYQEACWAATYTGTSKFGDSVQGGMYSIPYSQQSQAEACHRNGGVCGAMSHLGCVAAQAHGIPAYTVGQPGHCAYAVRPERGKWVGGFGGPDGGMHNRIFGNQAPTSYQLMEAVFSDDDIITQAYQYSHCARAMEAIGDVAGAIRLWNKALSLAPLHPFFRSALHQQMIKQGITSDQVFTYLTETISLYKGQGFAAVNMTDDWKEYIQAMSDEQKIQLYRQMHEMIATTLSSWAIKCESLIQQQADSLSTAAAREQFLGNAFRAHMDAKDATTFGQLLEWAVKTYVEKGEEETFSKAFAKAVSQSTTPAVSGDEKANAERIKKLQDAYNKAIFAAEQARSASAFQTLIAAATQSCGPCTVNIPLTSTVPGTPLQVAMFRISSTSQWDTPCLHGNLTTPTGGKCHSNKEAAPHMVVELPTKRFVSGCIIRKADGHEYRMKKATLYTSEDGATWVARQQTDDMPKEWAVTLPEGTSAKWLKIEFNHGQNEDFAHLSHFVVYGK